MSPMSKALFLLTFLFLILLSGCNTTTTTVSKPSTQKTPELTLWKQDKPRDVTEAKEYWKAKAAEQIFHQDLWKLIAAEMTLERHIDNPLVKSKIKWFAKNEDYLNRVSERASPYLYFIVQEIKQRKLPIELALLPVVESAYQPFAKSPSHASGLWQFIPSTGKRFGLKQDWWYDGRRDVVAATKASLTYLESIAKKFDGDWELALAGYNAGEFRIERELKKNLRGQRGQTFWDLRLVKETRNYVPSFLAIAEIIANPERYNINLKPIKNQPYFGIVDVGSQIDLATVAELSGMTVKEIYQLNPGYNVWATPPSGPHNIVLPLNKISNFKMKLAALPKEERVSWKQYTIKKGDSLGIIAARNGTSVTALKQANNLKSSRIRAGRSLLIPTAKRPLQEYTLSADARRYQGLKVSKDGKKYTYTVKRGDNLWDISRHYGIEVKQLCRWNDIRPNSILSLGQKLNIWIEEDNTTAIAKDNSSTPITGSGKIITYTVRSGDSLWGISQKFGVTVKQLQLWNKLGNSKRLMPGQSLEVRLEQKMSGIW